MCTYDNATRNNQELHNRLTDISVQPHTHRRKPLFAKQIPAVQVEVRNCQKKLVFAKQTPRHTRGKTGSRRKNLFLQNKCRPDLALQFPLWR